MNSAAGRSRSLMPRTALRRYFVAEIMRMKTFVADHMRRPRLRGDLRAIGVDVFAFAAADRLTALCAMPAVFSFGCGRSRPVASVSTGGMSRLFGAGSADAVLWRPCRHRRVCMRNDQIMPVDCAGFGSSRLASPLRTSRSIFQSDAESNVHQLSRSERSSALLPVRAPPATDGNKASK